MDWEKRKYQIEGEVSKIVTYVSRKGNTNMSSSFVLLGKKISRMKCRHYNEYEMRLMSLRALEESHMET